VRIEFTQTRRKFAATLANFGYNDFILVQVPETVEFRFFLNGAAVGSPVTKSGCNRKFFFGTVSSPVPLGTFQIDPGVDFDRVDITPPIHAAHRIFSAL
jgi:hypothetical protein